MHRDDDVRSSCFAALDVLCAKHGIEVPYDGGLDQGFNFRGDRVPFLNQQKGIFRARAQRGLAALSVQTSAKCPYADAMTPRTGSSTPIVAADPDHRDNRALRAANALQTPIVYFVGTRPGWYRPDLARLRHGRRPRRAARVRLTPGRMIGPYDEREPVLPDDRSSGATPCARRVSACTRRASAAGCCPAYANQCTICRLKETRLLDAAHIVPDSDEHGEPTVRNGLSLCSIHHRAFDEDLVGVSPDYQVRVHPRLLEEEDGPMLELLKGAHAKADHRPAARPANRPDRELLAVRFERFQAV